MRLRLTARAQVGGAAVSLAADNGNVIGVNSPTLFLAAGQLAYGEVYVFSIVVTSKDPASAGRSSTDLMTVTVEASAIVVTGALGPDRLVSAAAALTLTANPSDTMIVPYPFTYSWTCMGRCAGGLAECATAAAFSEACGLPAGAAEALFANAAVVTLPGDATTQSLLQSHTYRFACLIQKEPSLSGGLRSKTAYVRIAAAAGFDVLAVNVATESGLSYVNREDALGLQCGYTTNTAVIPVYTWSLTEGELPNGLSLVDLTEDIDGVQTLNNVRLNLRAAVLIGGSYTFQCRVAGADAVTGVEVPFGIHGEAQLEVAVNDAPTGGEIQVQALHRHCRIIFR